MKFKFIPDAKCENAEAIEEASKHADSCDSFKDLIFNWLAPEREVWTCVGTEEIVVDGVSSTIDTFCVVFNIGRQDIGMCEMPLSEVELLYPKVIKIEGGYRSCKMGSNSYSTKWMERWDKQFKRKFNEVFYVDQFTPEVAIEHALSYAMCHGGEVSFSPYDTIHMEDCFMVEEQEEEYKNYFPISVHAHYRHPVELKGWGEHSVVLLGAK